MARSTLCVVMSLLAVLTHGGPASAANVYWDDAGGSASKLWSDFGNWNPDGSVSGDDVFVGVDPTFTEVLAATNDRTLFDGGLQIASLVVGNGADVVNSTDEGATNGFELIVNGNSLVGGDLGSEIVVYGTATDGFDTDNLTINSGGSLILNSQTAQGTAVVEIDGNTGTGLLDINAGGTLIGTGRIDLEAAPGAPTSLLINDGTITANTPPFLIFQGPAAGTLQITATSANTYFDWDGGGGGVLNVNGNQTLDIDVPPGAAGLVDPFSGTMNLSTGATIDVASFWELDSGTINANTPAFGLIIIGQDPNPGTPARIDGANWTMTGGTINVDDAWDSLQFDSPVTATGGTINNEGTLIFNADATFLAGADFNMNGGSSSLEVNAAVVNIDTPNFGLDGLGGNGSTTISAGGILDLDLGAGGDTFLDHTINLNIGELDVTTSAATAWALNPGGEINAAGGGTSFINSANETFNISGDINVTANSTLTINSASTFTSQAVVDIEAGSTLNMGTVTYSGGSYTGGGELRKGTATIANDTTWNVATVDLDDGTTTLNANLTVNADRVEEGADGVDSTHTISDTAQLAVNINGGGSWVLDPTGTIAYNGNASANTYLAGSDLFVSGTIDHTGDGRVEARLNIGSTGIVNINTAGEPLRMNGGGLADDTVNRITGGTVNGPGRLGFDAGRALVGFGTINSDIEFFNSGNRVRADDGTLTINGAFIGTGGSTGTDDVDGILYVTSAWNTNSFVAVELEGGEIRGAVITNDNAARGIEGHGLVSARVINNTRIDAEDGGTLVVQTAGNNNDWDGVTGTGQLNAVSADLEIRDNALATFTGTVSAEAGQVVFVNGFELEFEPASTLSLAGSTYRSTHATDIGGTVSIGAGTSTLRGGSKVFEGTSNTTLSGDLALDNETQIDAGATFTGGGTLVNVAGRTLTLADGADVDVLLQNDGTLVLGASPGQTQGLDFEQTAGGAWDVELGGTGINDYDRMTLTGLAALDGVLNLSLINGYVPSLLDPALTILSASSVTGTFDSVVQPAGIPAGLSFDVIYNPGNVQLMVISQLLGDYNQNGSVDAADYVVWRATLGDAVTPFSGADGDGDGMVDDGDYGVWRGNFGLTAGSGSGQFVSAAVPEPTSLVILLGILILPATLRQRYSRS